MTHSLQAVLPEWIDVDSMNLAYGLDYATDLMFDELDSAGTTGSPPTTAPSCSRTP